MMPSPYPTTIDYKNRAKVNEATRPASSVANITSYPGYSGNYRSVGGLVVVEDTDSGIKITGTLTGVEASVTGGIHIHEGVSCASSSEPGGHYYPGMSSDPWATTT
jgi:Cu/Zn superoxide dismutase